MEVRDKLLNVVLYLKNVKKLNLKGNKIWMEELEEMSNKISSDKYIPPAIRALVDEAYVDECLSESKKWEYSRQSLLYPLPHNKSQEEIARKLAENFGVVVEGGPGTGKSHSIVNLVCHLVAHGKKVLVTGETDKSLKVLLDKMPKCIKPLCVSITENDIEALREVDNSIKQITDNLDLDVASLHKEIQDLENELDGCRNRQELLNDRLAGTSRVWDEYIKYCGRNYKLSSIKLWLEENKAQYSWIEDYISYMEKPPITDAKFSRLIYLVSNISKEELCQFREIGGFLYKIPSCSEILEKIQRVIQIRKNYISYKKAVKDWCISYNVDYDYEQIVRYIEGAEKFLEGIEGTWLKNILECAKKGDTVKLVLQQTILKCNYYIKKIGSIKKEISGHNVEVPKDMDIQLLEESFSLIYKQFEQRGKINKLFKLFHNQCESILEKCFVDGKAIETKEQVRIAKFFIEQCSVENNLKKLWNNSMQEYGAKEIYNINLNTIANLEDYINKIDMIINWNSKIKDRIINSMRKIVFLDDIDWYDIETYSELRYGVLSIKNISEYESLKSYIVSIERLISNIEGFEEIVQALNNYDTLLLTKTYKKIERLKEIASSIRELEYLIEKISKNCPKLVERLMNENDRLNMLINYKNFSTAWSWRQLNGIVSEYSEKFSPESLLESIRVEEEKENYIVNALVEKKAWHNVINKIEESEKRSLYTWRESVKRIGKGSNKEDTSYIDMAKIEMESFKDIIPVWVMPINKVIEKFSLCEKPFDVVIMDDSSESNIFAISALFRGEKAVIVGDDKQTNTEASGFNKKRIRDLINKHLKGIPHSEWFDMGTSIYSTALRIFPAKVILRENYRSMSEILGFSNKLCYSNEIIPKADFKLEEIFKSPVQAIKVDGERDKSKPINIREAESIVSKIVECCKDPKYKGMTMGVISLLGDAQSELIKNLLIKKLGDKEMSNRKLICGSASSFQGEEKDIIFLSMVISENVKFTALTKEADMRRFNLAASRARKQLWLFHSVRLESLNKNCVRAKLLKYCMSFSRGNSKDVNSKSIFRIA